MLAVVVFDIIPEIARTAESSGIDIVIPMIALLSGFLLFHVLEKTVSAHHAHEDEAACEDENGAARNTKGSHMHAHTHTTAVPAIGLLSAAGLVAHSFLDGVAIGLSFQVNTQVGVAVTLAVVAHDFSDGLNNVSLMLAHGNRTKPTVLMLLAGAIAPVIGVIVASLIVFSPTQLSVCIGLLGGFLLYIGTSSVLPEAHRERFSWSVFGLTIVGAVFTFLVTQALA